ncbi:MAG: glycosyltransferase family 4 protein [Chloroflexota bacterium]
MKIALVSPYDLAYPGGVGRHVNGLAGQFRRLGHQVVIIAPSSGDDERDEDGLYRVGRVTAVPANGSIARITLSLRMANRVRDILHSEQFDVVHLHEPLMPALPPTVLRCSQSVNVGTFHAYRHSSYGYFYGRPYLRRIFSRLDGRIAVSRAAWEFVSSYFPQTYSIIPNGVDLTRFDSQVEPLERFMDGRPNILFVGRLEKRKGLSYLIRAYPYLKRRVPNSRIIVVGSEGRHAQQYRSYTANHGFGDIVFVGRVSEEELPRYYATADVFCAPSTGGESFGMILVEAMALGKPVVASDIDGYRQVVADGVQGRLVPPKNPVALADALADVLERPDVRARYGAEGLIAARAYSWERVAGRVLTYYDEVRHRSAAWSLSGNSEWRVTWSEG